MEPSSRRGRPGRAIALAAVTLASAALFLAACHASPPGPAGAQEPKSAQEAFDRAMALWDRTTLRYGDVDAATRYLADAVRLDPAMAEAWSQRGFADEQSGRGEQALKDFDEAIRLAPDARRYAMRGLDAFANRRQYDAALSDLNRAIALDPAYGYAYLVRAGAHGRLNEFVRMREDLGQACTLKAGRACDLLQRNLVSVLRESELQPHGGDSSAATRTSEARQAAQPWFDRAAALYDRNARRFSDPEAAIGYLDQALRADPEFADAYYSRGSAYYGLGRYPQAVQDYDAAIRLAPTLEAFNFRGAAYFRLKLYDRAIADYNQAIAIDPKAPDANALYNRGIARAQLGLIAPAIEDYNQALQIAPSAKRYASRGEAYAVLGQDDQALEDYNRAIAAEPAFALAYYERALAYLGLNRAVQAREDFHKGCTLKFQQACDHLAKLPR